MGNLKSCCSYSDEHLFMSNQLVVGNEASPEVAVINTDQIHEDTNTFDVQLIMQDRSKLGCEVMIDSTNVTLYGDGKCRNIPMSDIHQLLHTKEELARVESSAGINDSDNCVAIHLRESGNCIPLFFKTSQDKDKFTKIALRFKQP
ncbi:uncharacterized protein CMU_014700 [Cryptosporidium muris RN66]|uniref:ISP1 C-terminal domain-containing protein n=1 Tax=Cryptosporidium muris (strain RN66) TaxID=441375 RepID=B6AF27_CRYMR|nr:uncharacterized protein CMU_014700 [Cryptosporidium muris RN66]EEA06794.1 hypothetical protein, conserved [Cryptosporidium muris RN66]|eukprot:XP_002141143.1 hypothetical protein [Cryptosporidium muris RN66]